MKIKHLLGIVAVVATATLGPAATASAVPHRNEPFSFEVPGGSVCAFELSIAGDDAGNTKSFYDAQARLVRSVGRGPNLTFTNLTTGKTYATQSNGGAIRWTYNADGSATTSSSGHTVTLLTPGDTPGPGATAIVGAQKIAVAPDGSWTVLQTSGRTTDICAALS